MYQSSLYQLTQSLGAVSMVNIEQIKKQQNLDYLQHLCTFIEKMNMNPIWYENQDPNSKVKILQLYQLAINYSKNMENDCDIAINSQRQRIDSLAEQEKQKTEYIRNMKEQYEQAKQEYKQKKHGLVRKVHTNLKRKLERMQENQQYQRHERQDRSHRSGQSTPREVIYYVPNSPPVNQMPTGYPYDPYNQPYQYPGYYQPPPPPQPFYPPTQSNNLTPNGGSTMNMVPEQQIGQFQMNQQNNDSRNHPQNTSLKRSKDQQIPGKKLVQSRKSIKQSKQRLVQPSNNHKPMTSSQMVRDQFQSYGSGEDEVDLLQKSNIIAKQEEVLVRMSKQVKKESQPTPKPQLEQKPSIKKSTSYEDDLGDLGVNSKKRISNPGILDDQLAQYDSIANININRNDTGSKITPKNRFQSKIHIQNQATTPKSSNKDLQIIDQQNADNILDNFPSSFQNSKFSKNNKKGENEPQKLYPNNSIPRKNNTKINSSLKYHQQVKDDAQSPEKTGNETSRLFKNDNKPKRQNKPQPQAIKNSSSKTENPVNLLENIFQSNVGHKKNLPSQQRQNYNSKKSNMGIIKQQTEDNKPQQLYSDQKPKRRSHIQTSSIQPPPQMNNLKVSFAQSQNGGMLQSQAYSVKFSKPIESKTPPKLQKQQQENYEDDFEDELNEKSVKQKPAAGGVIESLDDDEFGNFNLEHSRLPTSKVSKQQKSQIAINLPSHPTINQIKRQKFATLPNDAFIPKNQQTQNNIPATSIRNNLEISDNIFDQIMEIPMNSVIARRPSTINKPSRISKDVKSLKHIDSLNSSNNVLSDSSSTIASPSIHVIDPTGKNQTIMNRKRAELQKIQQEQQNSYKQSPRDEPGLRKSGLPAFDAMANSSVFTGQKKTSLIELNYVPNQNQKNEKKEEIIQDEDQFDIDLSQKSNIQKKQSKKGRSQKNIAQIRAKLQKIEKEAARPRDTSAFDKSIIQKMIKQQAKCEINVINTQKWAELQKFYSLQNQKIVQQLQKKKKKRQESTSKRQQVTPRLTKADSYYAQKLQYSKSLAKIQDKSGGNFMSVQPIRQMTESITINQPKVQQRPSPKNIDNKFAARLKQTKSKNQIQNIKKNLNKNPYQRDDELQNVIKQNKSKLLQNSSLSQDDF